MRLGNKRCSSGVGGLRRSQVAGLSPRPVPVQWSRQRAPAEVITATQHGRRRIQKRRNRQYLGMKGHLANRHSAEENQFSLQTSA